MQSRGSVPGQSTKRACNEKIRFLGVGGGAVVGRSGASIARRGGSVWLPYFKI